MAARKRTTMQAHCAGIIDRMMEAARREWSRRLATGCATPADRNRPASTGPTPRPNRTTRPSGLEAPQPRSRGRSAPLDRIRTAAPPRGDRHGSGSSRRPSDAPAPGPRAVSTARLREGTTRRPRSYASRSSATRGGRPRPTARRRSDARVTPNSTARTSRSWIWAGVTRNTRRLENGSRSGSRKVRRPTRQDYSGGRLPPTGFGGSLGRADRTRSTASSRTSESGGPPSRVSTFRATRRFTAAGSSDGVSWS